jgi:hypothetical protein
MDKVLAWLRNGLAVVGLVALGFWLGSGRGVSAQAGSGVQFQLTGVEPGSSLLVYDPGSRNVYVYKGVAMGHSTNDCTYMFQISNLGGEIHRVPCETH